jgi:hypothetical protein
MRRPIPHRDSTHLARQPPIRGCFDGQRQREGAALSWRALHADPPTKQVREFLADRQTQPRAAISARCRTIYLAELIEDLSEMLGGNPDTRVHDNEGNRLRRYRHVDSNASLFRKLDRVGEQVEKDLVHLVTIGPHGGEICRRLDPNVESLGLHEGGDRAHCTIEQLLRIESGNLDVGAASLDLREVEDVVDQLE